jgi:hypothetical protein
MTYTKTDASQTVEGVMVAHPAWHGEFVPSKHLMLPAQFVSGFDLLDDGAVEQTEVV